MHLTPGTCIDFARRVVDVSKLQDTLKEVIL